MVNAATRIAIGQRSASNAIERIFKPATTSTIIIHRSEGERPARPAFTVRRIALENVAPFSRPDIDRVHYSLDSATCNNSEIIRNCSVKSPTLAKLRRADSDSAAVA